MQSSKANPTVDYGNQQLEATDVSTLSKTQLKKLNKRQRWLDSRGERRKVEREKRKLKRKALALERDQQQEQEKSCDEENNGKQVCDDSKARIEPTPGRRMYNLMANSSNKFRVVIDMDFEDYMTDAELKKSVLQVSRIYAANRHSENPCQLYISSVKGKVRDAFEAISTGYKNWDAHCSGLDYVYLFKCDTTTTTTNEPGDSDGQIPPSSTSRNFIYLSGDSDTVLSDVDTILKDDSKIFVIGGLVDHNRHKNLCHNRALERGIPTARLPIKEHVTLSQRHILATLTVFEIMLQVLGSRMSWPEALVSTIPKRKLAQPE